MFFLKFWLNVQRYASVSCASPFSESMPGTRRCSVSIIDSLRKRTDLQDFLEGLRQTYSRNNPEASAYTGSSSFFKTDEQETTDVPETESLQSGQMKNHSTSPTKSFRRNSEVHPHYCQACVALLLGVKSGGSLARVPSPSISPVSSQKPSFLTHPGSSSHTHELLNALQNTSLYSVPENTPSSIPVQITPPSPVHKSQNTPSPLHIFTPSPVHTSTRHMSISSPVDPPSPFAHGPHSPSLSSDLSHLHRCLHHIISRRTSSPVLKDHIDAIRQARSTDSLCVPLSHRDTDSFTVKERETGPGLVVGDVT